MLPTRKYGVPPEEVEKKSLESEQYKLDYDFKRLKKVDTDAARYSRYVKKVDKRNKRIHRSSLNVGEVVYVLSSKLKKKDGRLYFIKSQQTRKVSLTRIRDS